MSVAVAGRLCAVYPWESPGGWHLLGRTPVRLFDAAAAEPALLRAGDELEWLAMSRGFQGTAAALAAGDFHLSQRAPAGTLAGIGVDFNDGNPLKPDFGAFTLAPEPDDAHTSATGDRFRVIARSGLRLREGPGTQFDIVGMLSAGQVVFVTSVADGWAKVDVEGDGQIDGFASAGFLEKLT